MIYLLLAMVFHYINFLTIGRIFRLHFVIAYFCNRIPVKYYDFLMTHFFKFLLYIDNIDDYFKLKTYNRDVLHSYGYVYVSSIELVGGIDRLSSMYNFHNKIERIIFSPKLLETSSDICKIIYKHNHSIIEKYDDHTQQIINFHNV